IKGQRVAGYGIAVMHRLQLSALFAPHDLPGEKLQCPTRLLDLLGSRSAHGLAAGSARLESVSGAAAQQATRTLWATTATTLAEEGHDSRHPSEAVLLTSDSVHVGRCTCARSPHAAASPRAPVSPPNRVSPISLFGR